MAVVTGWIPPISRPDGILATDDDKKPTARRRSETHGGGDPVPGVVAAEGKMPAPSASSNAQTNGGVQDESAGVILTDTEEETRCAVMFGGLHSMFVSPEVWILPLSWRGKAVRSSTADQSSIAWGSAACKGPVTDAEARADTDIGAICRRRSRGGGGAVSAVRASPVTDNRQSNVYWGGEHLEVARKPGESDCAGDGGRRERVSSRIVTAQSRRASEPLLCGNLNADAYHHRRVRFLDQGTSSRQEFGGYERDDVEVEPPVGDRLNEEGHDASAEDNGLRKSDFAAEIEVCSFSTCDRCDDTV